MRLRHEQRTFPLALMVCFWVGVQMFFLNGLFQGKGPESSSFVFAQEATPQAPSSPQSGEAVQEPLGVTSPVADVSQPSPETASPASVATAAGAAKTADVGGPSGQDADGGGEIAGQTSSKEFVRLAWEASSQGNLEKLDQLVEECLRLYGERARSQQAQLEGLPSPGKEGSYQALNDAGTILFIQAEARMNYGKTEAAIETFQRAIDQFPSAQAWDPRGWFWSIKEKSQASIDVMTGKVQEDIPQPTKGLVTLPQLVVKGKEDVVDYRKYGEFLNVGKEDYEYRVNDPAGLSAATGEGIYPNTGDILKNPGFKKAKDEGRLEGSHWDFVHSDDLEAALYKWSTAKEPYGVRLFFIGAIFEKARMYYEAIKTYHAIVVHFPKTVARTYWQTPWYPAQAAIAKIQHIIRTHPELKLKTKWMKIEIDNGFDNEVSNDVFRVYPGVISKKSYWDQLKERFHLEKGTVTLGAVKKRVGNGKVQLVQYENGHWQMLVDGQPFVVRGITYSPTKIGQSPDKGTLVSWMHEDTNTNGLADGPFDSWVDSNHNNEQDPDEPTVGDFRLMQEMGVNVIREYHQPFQPNKDLLRKMHAQYGFMVAMGDFLGKYTHGSGASWFEGTDYENPEHQKNMMESVRRMVMDFKDEPYILLWVLGNENNYGVASNADKKPEAYYKFANEVARMIKSLDPNHPVAICNGDILYLDVFGKNAPDIDIYGANVYRGDYGFGAFWDQVFEASGKPAFITEYGCPAYAHHLTLEEGEVEQANYHRGNWMDIEANTAGKADGTGNSLGGFVFEWMDEWWKNYEPFYHDRRSDAIGPFPGGYYFEEWFGITGQGSGKHSPFMRHLRKSYSAYKEMWTGQK